MPDAVQDRPSRAASVPAPADVETVADRLRRLEQALERLQHAPPVGPMPDGLAAGPMALGGGSVSAAVLRAVLPAAAGAVADPVGGLWGRVPILAELRLMVRMYLDPRYRLSRVSQFGVPAVLALMVMNYLMWNQLISIPLIPLVEEVIERGVLIVLAVVLYKLLAREAARYAAVLDYLMRYGTR